MKSVFTCLARAPQALSTRQFQCRFFCSTLKCMSSNLPGIVSPYTSVQQQLVKDLNSSNVGSSTQQDMVNLNDSEHMLRGLDRLRVIPKDPTFYMSNPPHEETMRNLNILLRKYINLPTVTRDETAAVSWMTFEEYSAIGGGSRLKPIQYKSLVKLLNRLSLIDPQLMPNEIWEGIRPFVRDRGSKSSLSFQKSLDQFGRASAVGRRKTSSARVYVTKNTEAAQGQVLVNGKNLIEYFPRLVDRDAMLYPLKVVDLVGQFNIFATVQGGGLTGQSNSIALAIARGIVMHNPLLKSRLHRAGCLTRDARKVERKKPGKPKARKSYTWVKR
ncbi:mitochondrial 37S ribosomal protein uS9m [Magnusiomyces paraingens]|uniref:Small ribosomal subunit protein uS9m n=1 Tax=Magnusiomyces paraingens TaxID=2606893 RepID=A0A5E8AWT5_9ASCO|nr:uncharacterized protein SAPINGB_P000003 [Saprochaete ingens]VVT43477.1 unnamed protein product [Saprochaete ingens]